MDIGSNSEIRVPAENAAKLILISNLCPGDIMTATAAVESLHRTYPGRFITDVRTPVPDIWFHNPFITSIADNESNVRRIEMHYPSIDRSNQESVPFLAGFTTNLGNQLGIPLSLRVNRPMLYLTQEEKTWIDQIQQHYTGYKIPFWLVSPGIKNDFTTKAWPTESYQEVIDATRGEIQWVQIGAKEHSHPDLKGVIDLRGKTSHRELIRLAWHCDGGLGPITYLQHLCAAWQKPYICLAGGREPLTWTQYPLQHTLHSFGSLECCRTLACWKSRVVALGDGDSKDKDPCKWPLLGMQRPVAKCMAMIKPADVLAAIRRASAC
jgi:hypothetical protein